jgi:hypothetical protein
MLWFEVADCIATNYIRWSLAEMHSTRKLGARSDGCRTRLRQKLDSRITRGPYLIDKKAGMCSEAVITPAIGVPSTEDEQAAMEAAPDAVVVGGERPTIPSPNWALLFTIQVFMSIYTTLPPHWLRRRYSPCRKFMVLSGFAQLSYLPIRRPLP